MAASLVFRATAAAARAAADVSAGKGLAARIPPGNTMVRLKPFRRMNGHDFGTATGLAFHLALISDIRSQAWRGRIAGPGSPACYGRAASPRNSSSTSPTSCPSRGQKARRPPSGPRPAPAKEIHCRQLSLPCRIQSGEFLQDSGRRAVSDSGPAPPSLRPHLTSPQDVKSEGRNRSSSSRITGQRGFDEGAAGTDRPRGERRTGRSAIRSWTAM